MDPCRIVSVRSKGSPSRARSCHAYSSADDCPSAESSCTGSAVLTSGGSAAVAFGGAGTALVDVVLPDLRRRTRVIALCAVVFPPPTSVQVLNARNHLLDHARLQERAPLEGHRLGVHQSMGRVLDGVPGRRNSEQ